MPQRKEEISSIQPTENSIYAIGEKMKRSSSSRVLKKVGFQWLGTLRVQEFLMPPHMMSILNFPLNLIKATETTEKDMKDSYIHEHLPYCAYQLELPILRKFTILVLIATVCNSIATTIYFIFNWNIILAYKVAFTQIGCVAVSIMTFNGLELSKHQMTLMELKKKMWSFEEFSSELSNEKAEKKKQLKVLRVITIIFSLCVIIVCIPLSGDPREFFIFAYITGDKMNQKALHFILFLVTNLNKLYFGLMLMDLIFLVSFIMTDVSHHYLLLGEKLKIINRKFNNEANPFDDRTYQCYVDKTLKNCISQHILILRYVKILRKEVKKSILLYVLGGASFFAFLFFSAKKTKDIIFLVKCCFIQAVSVIVYFIYANSGQELSDQSEKLHRDLCECPWFLWNRSNRSKYIVFLMNTRRPVTFTSLDFTVNLNLLVVVARRTLTFLAGVEQLIGME